MGKGKGVYLKEICYLKKKLNQIGLIPEEVISHISKTTIECYKLELGTHTVIMSTNRLMQVGSKIFTFRILGHYTPLILGPAKSLGALPYIYTNENLQFIYLFLWEGHTHNPLYVPKWNTGKLFWNRKI